jgi:hypothetical protein
MRRAASGHSAGRFQVGKSRVFSQSLEQCESNFYRGARHEEASPKFTRAPMREADVGSQSADTIKFYFRKSLVQLFER